VNALAARIARLIETQGPLSIAQFMTVVLHDPDAGYYATRDPFGGGGDFITAPEISQTFGELVGLWCAQVWRDQGSLVPARLVELGPGRGTLMADALRAAHLAPDFLEAIEVVLVEASPSLRAMQENRLKDCGVRVTWSATFDNTGQPTLLIANEFFDALPIRQYVRTERGWCERMVVIDRDDALAFALTPIALAAESDPDAPLGAVKEISPAALALAENIGRTITRYGGGALVFDYGYAKPEFGETLQAVGGHAFKAVLETPGVVDLSAHVDFGSLAAAARRGGARTHGPVGQGQFLEAMGIRARARRLSLCNPDQEQSILAAIDRLMSPAQMGTLFKALAITPPNAPPPPGF
jgi:NADH dehydrogenase [ubiquinone] 1 alpha subcomplex assembly factor 7